jgi:hypothetical protein
MLNLKKTMVAVLALGSSAVFAGSMGPVCSSVNVTVPCESTAWGFGADALYLQPATTAGEYNFVAQNGQGRYVNFPNKWAWGFKLEGSYHYGTGSDTNLNWYHVNKAATKSFTAAGYTSPTFGLLGAGTTASASLDPKWDQVNLEFGQHVDFGENKSIRFHGGVEYARVANSATYTLTNTTVMNAVSTANPTYNGFGPRVGADMNYDWGNGLGIYANGAGAMLVGTSKQNNSAAWTGSFAVPGSAYSSFSQTTIVPELEAKLGIKYDYAMAQGDLTLDVGWMWINYFNSSSSQLSTGVDVVSGDFGLQGLYFGLKWLGNVA